MQTRRTPRGWLVWIEALERREVLTVSTALTPTAIVSGQAASLTVTGMPATETAGVPFNVTVTARDSSGNLATGYAGTVSIGSNDWRAVLPANYTFTAADAGQHTFTVTLEKSGSRYVTVGDTSNSALQVASSSVTVAPAAVNYFTVQASAMTVTAGTPVSVTVTAEDPYNNVATGYTGTVTFSSNDAAAVLPANYTFTAADAGVHVFSATLETAGTHRITVADTSNANINGAQYNITVNPAPTNAVTSLAMSGISSPVIAGAPFSFTVSALGSNGAVATSYRGTVHVTSSDPSAVLPANYTFTAADAGQHTFAATLKTAGTQSLSVADTSNSALSATQSGITVSAPPSSNPAVSLSVSGAPTSITAGVPFTMTVTARDSSGNLATGYAGTVSFGSNDWRAVLPANYTFTATDAGQHTFTVILEKSGSRYVTVGDTSNSALQVASSSVAVAPAAVNFFTVQASAMTVTAGTPVSVTVTAEDPYNNVAAGYTGTVTFSSNDAAAVLPANYTFTAADAGVHVFSATFETVGTHRITVADTSNANVNGTQYNITVNPAPTISVTSLALSGIPSSATSGTPFSFTVTAHSSNGSIATGYTGTVRFTSSDPSAVLPANYTFTTADAGQHTFTVTLQSTGNDSITVTDTASAALTATSSAIAVSAAGALTWTPPSIPQHYSWIRVAELAYGGQLGIASDQQLLVNSIDMVIGGAPNFAQARALAPNTPLMAYGNVSNIYGSLLTSWMSYAASHGLDPEGAFYHVSQPVAFSGNGASSQPVAWFWSVSQGTASLADSSTLTDYTSAANSGSSSIPFGAEGQAVYLGYTDPFNQINVALRTLAAGGWQYQLQYPTAVDASGTPTAWAALQVDSDSTSGLARSGQITFEPPMATWVMASINGSAPLYYVRLVTTASGTAPTASTILGADYTNSTNGGYTGTIPAFDYVADTDHDGYLNPTEWASHNPADTARFAYQSRVFTQNYGPMRFSTNPGDAGFQQWAASYAQQILAANPQATGIFMDNSGIMFYPPSTPTIESTSTFYTGYGALLHQISTAIAPHWIIQNDGGTGGNDPAVQQNPINYLESEIAPVYSNWHSFLDVAQQLAEWNTLTNPTPYYVIDASAAGGSPTDPQTQLATLAEYYLLANPTSTFLDPFGGYSPSSDWSQHWFGALTYNVGQPTGSWYQYATGADPANTAYTYNVYARNYQNALVLYRPLSFDNWSLPNGATGSASAVTFQLGGNYQLLNADGTLGPVTTSVSLQNGQGAILIRA